MTAPIFNFYSKTHKLFVRISILPTETCSEKYSAFQFLIKKKKNMLPLKKKKKHKKFKIYSYFDWKLWKLCKTKIFINFQII